MVPGSTQRVVTLWASTAVAIAQCRAIIQCMVEKGLQTDAFSAIPPAVGTGSNSIVASELEKYPKVGRTDSPIKMANAEVEIEEHDDMHLQPVPLSIDTTNHDIERHKDPESYDIFNEVDDFDRFQRNCSSSVVLSADVISALPLRLVLDSTSSLLVSFKKTLQSGKQISPFRSTIPKLKRVYNSMPILCVLSLQTMTIKKINIIGHSRFSRKMTILTICRETSYTLTQYYRRTN